VVSSAAVDMYIERFGGGPRIKKSDICMDCLREKALQVKRQSTLMADVKTANILLKNPIQP